MQPGEMLVAHRMVGVADMARAQARQQRTGQRLTDVLLEMGVITHDQLLALQARLAETAPVQPRSLAETGIGTAQLLGLTLRVMAAESCATTAGIMRALCLPYRLAEKLLDEARSRGWVQAVGAGLGGQSGEARFALSQDGRAALAESVAQTTYVGPAPVPLAAFQAQVARQRLDGERLDAARLRGGLGGLSVDEALLRKLLPAINAGRSILLFGPAGNGKTSVAARIAALFQQVIFVPYAVEVAGQIMRVFDAGLHVPALSDEDRAQLADEGLAGTAYDDRFVLCRRPFAVAGGELTMEMLDLQWDPATRFYDAPLHIKALGGVLLIDDFGRQRVDPRALLNRWIVPMEDRVDYLRLHSGKSFRLPFDALLIFSTNIDPRDIMDPALLRRIPYKIRLLAPEMTEYRALFASEAQARGLALEDGVAEHVAALLAQAGDFGLAYFQPKFVCAQAAEVCASFGTQRVVTRALAGEALANLYVQVADHL